MERIKQKIRILKDGKGREVAREIQHQTIGYLVAAFGLVAGLAWNEAVKAFIEYAFPLSKNSLFVKFIYAILVTFVVVVITIYLRKFEKKASDTETIIEE